MGKGPKQMAPYAVRLKRAKEVIEEEERILIIRHIMEMMNYAFVIALSDVFGFGADRAMRVEKRVDEVLLEFGALQSGTDSAYALGALERRYRQIIPEGAEKNEQEEPPKGHNGGDGTDRL